MKIGLIDADLMDKGTRHPNLALMKISAYYKSLDHTVELIWDSYDKIKYYDHVFISKVFSYTFTPKWIFELPNVTIGGTGFYPDGGPNLPDEIEHFKPDYDLYNKYIETQIKKGKRIEYFSDYLNYSIGFTTRGCIRKCDFCVNKKYDKVFRHSPVSEFLDPKRPYIYLWDDNFLAFSEWEDILNELEATGKPFQFRQGLDIRLLNERKAFRLSRTNYHGDFMFAFDNIADKDIICEKLQLWKRYSNKIPKFYVLCAYESQDGNDINNIFTRVHILMKLGSIPYIMRHSKYQISKYRDLYIQIARWCNQPHIFKKMSFRQFCERNQYYHKNTTTICSALRAMVSFENDYPEIAEKYFDLRFEDENIYRINYGFGRKYCNKPSCNVCKLSKCTWQNAISGKIDTDQLIKNYMTKEIDLLCLSYKNAECQIESSDAAKFLVSILINVCFSKLENIIMSINSLEPIYENNSLYPFLPLEMYIDVVKYIANSSSSVVFYQTLEQYISRNLSCRDKKYNTQNFLKTLALMDLIVYDLNKGFVFISPIGKEFLNLSYNDKAKLWMVLQYRLPIIQHFLSSKKDISLFKMQMESNKIYISSRLKEILMERF